MAVEIPVYVDIQGAFNRAVSEIPKEMPKLEKVISRNALKIPIYADGYKTLDELLRSPTVSAKQLKQALSDIEYQFNKVSKAAAGKKSTPAMVNNLAKAYGLVKQRITGFYDANSVAAMRLEHDINRVIYKVNEMKTKLNGLSVGSDQYNKINYELQIQQKRLAELTVQQMKYKAGIDASTAAYQKQSGIVKQLTGYFSGLYAVHTLLRFVKQVRDVTGELEYQRVALGHLLQDAEFGNELFAKTIEAAKESPFRIGQLVTYTKQLAAYRIEQENLFDTTQRLADISAGLGVDMNRLILAYGQVRAASVLRGQELRQFTEAGIPLVELLAEKFRKLGKEGTTTADVFKLISERAVPFEYVKEIFEELTDAGGMFYKMQEEQAKTLKGRWDKLKDAYDQALMSLGDSSTFQNWNDTVLTILNGISKNLNGIVRVVNAGSIAWAAYWLATKSGLSYGTRLTAMFIKEYGIVKTLTFGVGGLTAAFKKLWIAMKANWVGLAISAVAGLVTYFTTFKKKVNDTTGELSEMEKAIEKMKLANKEFDFEMGVIARYKELSETTERTANQNKLLSSTMEELKGLFPDIADKIGDENISLSEQNDLLEKNAKLRKEDAIEEAKKQLETQKDVIRGLEDEKEAAKAALEIARRREEQARLAEKSGPLPSEQRYGPGTYASASDLKQATIDAAKAASSAEKEYERISEELAVAVRRAEELEELIDPSKKTKEWHEWQKEIQRVQGEMMKVGDSPLFTPEEIGGLQSVYDLFGKLKKRSKDLAESIKGMKEAFAQMAKGTDAYIKMEEDIAKEERTKAIADAIQALFGFNFKSSTGSDKRLSNLKNNISEITNAYKKFIDLRKYMSEQRALDEIGVLFPQLKGWEPTLENTLSRLRGLITNYKGPKDKTFLDMQRAVDTEISNLKFDNLKKTIEDGLKQVSEDIKRSETARKFYQDILGLTGDENIATNLTVSVYGGIGEEFKDRIKKQLVDALSSLDAESFAGLDDAVRNAFDEGDYEYLMKNLEKVPEKLRDVVKQVADDAEKYNADLMKNFADLVVKYGNTAQKISTIDKKYAKEIDRVREAFNKLTQEEKDSMQGRFDEIIKALEGERDLEKFKAGEDYIKFFAEINVMTAEQAATVRGKLRSAYLKAFHDGAISADELRKNLRAIDTQFKKLSESTTIFGAYLSGGFEKANEKLQEYSDNISVLAEKMKSGKELDSSEQAYASRMLQMFGSGETANIKSYSDLISKFQNSGGIEKAGEAFGQMGEGMSAMAANGPGALAIVDAIIKAVNSTIVGIQQIIDQLNEVRSEQNKVGDWFRYIGDFNKYAYSGWEKLKSGDVIGASVDTISSIISVINNVQKSIVKKYDKQIKEQADAIEDLRYSYERLGVAIEDAFGADYIYNYNEQMKILEAQAEAYRNQAAAERAKGKSADEDTAKGYEKSARDIENQIKDAQSKLSEFFTGTDVTSAAADFANAWIEAYKQFGNTTAAMQEKFNEMVQNMIQNSLAARIVQSVLQPLFDQIDEMARSGGMLTAGEIANIAAQTPEKVRQINDAMNTLMATLASAGYDIRRQPGQFTGIARNIAGATEESINGLAAGVNTQNFYMSHIDMNVAAILATLTGGASTAGAGTTGEYVDPYKDQMLLYASYLPQMQGDMSAVRALLERVIKPNGTSATHYVATRM